MTKVSLKASSKFQRVTKWDQVVFHRPSWIQPSWRVNMPRKFLGFKHIKNPLSEAVAFSVEPTVEFLSVIWSWCSFPIFLKGTPSMPYYQSYFIFLESKRSAISTLRQQLFLISGIIRSNSKTIIIKPDYVKTLTSLKCYNSIPIRQWSIVSTTVCFLLLCAPPEVKDSLWLPHAWALFQKASMKHIQLVWGNLCAIFSNRCTQIL